MQIKFTVDENHLVRGFGYHDGRLTGVLDEGQDKALIIRSEAGDTLWLRFVGAEHFLVNHFLSGNVLSEIFLWSMSAKDLPRDILSRFLKATGFANVDHATLEKLIDANRGGYFARIECSYGASVDVVCSDVIVERKSTSVGADSI